MEPDATLKQTNVDDVVRQAADDAAETLSEGDTRLDFLKKAGLGGGAVVGSGALIGALTPDGPFDTPFTAAKVLSAVKKTGFLQ
jgi:hypothetical protein